MSYNPIMVIQAASKATKKLEESGQVGRVETTTRAIGAVTIPADTRKAVIYDFDEGVVKAK